MKKTIFSYLHLILFWFFVFFTFRIIFYSGINFLLKDVSYSLILVSFFHALRLDLSMIAYLSVIPIILFFIYFLFPRKLIIRTLDIVNYIFILLYSITAIGEMCLYREWKAKLSMQALQHFTNPSEVFKSASLGLTLLFLVLVFISIAFLVRIYNRKVSLKIIHPVSVESFGKYRWKGVVFFISTSIFCVVSLRGGVQQIPIQTSDAFFCIEPTVNDAAVNPLWNIMYNIADYEINFKTNPYTDFEIPQAKQIVKTLFEVKKDTTISFLNTIRPNIVFIILEGWSTACVKSFGGDNYAPFLDSLSRQGIRFTNLYPAGYVSDQGVPAVLSGYPCVPRIAIINQNSKSIPLPCINNDLAQVGYHSGFAFGGDLSYGNIRSYIYNKKFEVVKEEKDFDGSIPRGRLGIQDKPMSTEYLKILNTAPVPFVYAWFTLSTHMPYDIGEEKKKLTSLENDYTNSIVYSDKAINNFFSQAKKQSWYKNTLFVLVSDHSHGCHKDFNIYAPDYHRIPLVFFGEVINEEWRGKAIDSVFSQVDVVKTILQQMQLNKESEQYVWSKNMFNLYTKSFAFYCNFGGTGFITNKGFVGFQTGSNNLVVSDFEKHNPLIDSLTLYTKAFQETIYEDYRLK